MAQKDNYILVSLDDEKSKSIAEVLSSPTCKKIINYLAEVSEGEASQKDLSDALKIPMNTLDYNIKKLLSSGFVQKRKNFFWSKKGKKIIMYELSNKSVVISHKKHVSEKIKSIIPAAIITAAGTFALWTYQKISLVRNVGNDAVLKSQEIMATAGSGSNAIPPETILSPHSNPLWLWFLVGGIVAILIISVVNWKKL